MHTSNANPRSRSRSTLTRSSARTALKPYIPSKEKGFMGTPSKWFSEKQYRESLCRDLAYHDVKDYYFGSYSHFCIHEEMLKD